MTLYRSKPAIIDAAQNIGNFADMQEFAGDKVRINQDGGALELLAGKEGAQGWVPVPAGHWLVCQPGDKTDMWPVDPDYFAAKYELAQPRGGDAQ